MTKKHEKAEGHKQEKSDGKKSQTGVESCSFGLPLISHAEEAGTNLFRHFTGGEQLDLHCVMYCSWVLAGYGISVGMPHPHVAGDFKLVGGPISSGESFESLKSRMTEALKPLAEKEDGKEGMKAEAIPWIMIAELAMLILQWLRNRNQPQPA